eukprot:gene3432-3658_t
MSSVQQEIDVSTQQLCDFTSKLMNRKYSTEQVATVWHEVGNVIKNQLLQRKAVRLTSFGTFSLSKGYPVFSLASEMIQQFKLTYSSPLTLDNIPTSAINFAQISNNIKISRDIIEKIYNKFLTALGRNIYEGRNILITINRIAEISIINYQVNCDFISEFYSLFQLPNQTKPQTMNDYRTIAKKTTNLLTTQQQYLLQKERTMNDNIPTVQTGLAIGGESNDGFSKRATRPRSASAARARNPITGEDYGRPQSANRAAVGRNPGTFRRPGTAGSNLSQASISTSSLLHSPRSQYDDYGRPGNRGGGGNQRSKQRTLMNARPGGGDRSEPPPPTPPGRTNPEDPRAIAAKALTNKNNDDIIQKVRAKITERGGSTGIKSITKLLAIMDTNGDKKLNKEELKYGLRDYGIQLTPIELEQIFYYFDRDNNGLIDVNEFLIGLKGDMSSRRQQLIHQVFNILDTDRSGTISVDEVLSKYDLTWHPEVRAGRMTVKEAAKDFMLQWEKGRNAKNDGIITFEEFEEYYKEISASIDDDDYFELMIRNAWRIAGGGGDDMGDIDLYGGYDDQQNNRYKPDRAKARTMQLENRFNSNNNNNHNRTVGNRASTPVNNRRSSSGTMDPRRGGNNNNNRTAPAALVTAFDKHQAASKLAAAYRGRIARKQVEQEKRKVQANQQRQYEEEEERSRPRPREILRPKGKSYIGF